MVLDKTNHLIRNPAKGGIPANEKAINTTDASKIVFPDIIPENSGRFPSLLGIISFFYSITF